MSKHTRTFIREWRKHRDLTQEQIAEAADCSIATISRLETGDVHYGQERLELIERLLNCTAVDLIARAPNMPERVFMEERLLLSEPWNGTERRNAPQDRRKTNGGGEPQTKERT